MTSYAQRYDPNPNLRADDHPFAAILPGSDAYSQAYNAKTRELYAGQPHKYDIERDCRFREQAIDAGRRARDEVAEREAHDPVNVAKAARSRAERTAAAELVEGLGGIDKLLRGETPKAAAPVPAKEPDEAFSWDDILPAKGDEADRKTDATAPDDDGSKPDPSGWDEILSDLNTNRR